MYTPRPKDLSRIELSENIQSTIEEIARNTHEVWAQSRILEGWVYGPKYDSLNKTHPCLIPYDQLQESEKDYDRNTSIQVIKSLIYFGFKIK